MGGYFSEIFSSFQGEGGSVRGSCQGKRQIFIRFSGCNLASEGRPCIWCDSPGAQTFGIEICRFEKIPGSGKFIEEKNPVMIDQIVEWIRSLKTPDLHSVSLTGGEPTGQPDILGALCLAIEDEIYLETNGTLPDRIESIAELVDYASVDIKDQTALPYKGWSDILEKELKSIAILKDAGSKVFSKIVVSEDTKTENIRAIAKELDKLSVPLAIQPVTRYDRTIGLSRERLFKLVEGAAQYLSAEDITLSLQTHKLIGLL